MATFARHKELLDILVVPVVLTLLALVWPSIHAWHRRRAFQRLIERELEEVGPHPETPQPKGTWTHHQSKRFVHQAILKDAPSNIDFVLSLKPDLVYVVSQLWDARRESDAGQWLWHLQQISRMYPSNAEIAKVVERWETLIKVYSASTCQSSDS